MTVGLHSERLVIGRCSGGALDIHYIVYMRC